jgi:hypothetical protein
MGQRDGKSLSALGFLTVVPHEQHGLFGGLLVIDSGGRPLEFHCTAPVKTNRAQEILFGPMLEPYIYGEQIGQTLVSAARQKPTVLCIDLAAMLAVRQHVDIPVTLVQATMPAESETEKSAKNFRVDEAHDSSDIVSFSLARCRLAVATDYRDDQALVSQRLAAFSERLDLAEPFARIREAIDEAQRSGR